MLETGKMECMTAGYAASTSSTTSDTVSGSTETRGVRCVRLFRPKTVGTISRNPTTGRCGPGFGFSLRGGHEHGVGFFVSKVDPGSEAAKQGLQVGDQIMRVNGHRVGDAVHSELLHFIACQTRLKMKVRNVGMVPAKENVNDPLTWHIVSELSPMFTLEKRSNSPYIRRNSSDNKEMRISILVPPKSRLGCGLCKGPEWRPGIFIQFTKENGLAKKAGLRPGDQIIKCNGIDFRNIPFTDAVLVMKKSNRLDLTLLPEVGNDLFAAESSGYNSSASSAAGGENSPSSSECKRLSIVTEEVTDLGDKYNQFGMSRLRKHSLDNLDTKWKKSSDFESDVDTEMSNGYHVDVNKMNQTVKSPNSRCRMPQNSTIINLSENGTTIQSCYDDMVMYPVMKTMRSNSNVSQVEVGDRKTVVVEVHQSHENDNIINDASEDFNVPSESSYSSYASHCGTSLSCALSEEIKRRAERLKNNNETLTPVGECRKPKSLKNLDNKNIEQHNALMDEFKKAHKRMFAKDQKSDNEPSDTVTKEPNENGYSERQPLKVKSELIKKSEPPEKPKTPQIDLAQKVIKGPPLPPPLPPIEAVHLVKDNTSSTLANRDETDRPPSTPTPDYDTLEKPSPKAIQMNGTSKITLEHNAIESPKLMSPISPKIRPQNAFRSQSLTNGTLTKSPRPISITIGEYPSNITRKEPSKLDFLAEPKNTDTRTESEPVTSRLQSELAKTLSRSNLKKKTEALELKLSQKMDNLIMDNKNFHMRYPDTGVILTPPPISIPKISKLLNSTSKMDGNTAKDVNSGNLQNPLSNFHQVTMMIKDSRVVSAD